MTILCLSSIDWDFIWQGHQEIMSRLGRQGHTVLFVENTGVRSPRLKDCGRIWSRLRNRWKGVAGFREVAPGVTAYAPLALPFPYFGPAIRFNAWIISRAIRRWLAAVGGDAPVAWTFLPTRLARAILREISPRVTVYYCIDNFLASSDEARRVEASEKALFREADLVFVTSRELQAKAQQSRPHAELFPFAVNFEAFEERRSRPAPEPADLAAIPRPRIGYLGGLHQWVDFSLLAETARALPEMQFVLIGPEQADLSPLRGIPNLHRLGAKAHALLPAYLGGLDVATIPYRLTDYTRNVYPTKLNEYFAMGLPIVATPLPEVEAYNREFGDLVEIGRDSGEFVKKIRLCLQTAGNRQGERIAAARANGWSARVEAMQELISQKISQSAPAPRSWQDSARRLARTGWKPLVTAGLLAAAGWFLVAHTPFVWWMAEPLRMASASDSADAILVLAGGVGESGEAGQGYEERVAQAIRLYHEGRAGRIVFSSGITRSFRETEVMQLLAASRGVPPDAMVQEKRGGGIRRSMITLGNLARQEGWRSVMIVTSPYNMKRALKTWEAINPSIRAFPAPPSQSDFYGYREGAPAWNRGASFPQARAVLDEWLKMVYYRLKGWI